ncbi:PCC domain-containing protein [Variovorax sp. GB1P17]|uniref:PCC domain-containing protein n=1 Tax=Variovorax sp. GB1P17 TaxID=3443740 RepID=UPI003F47EC05
MFTTLVQPGIPETQRLESIEGPLRSARFSVAAGVALLAGISQGMHHAGMRSGTLRMADFDVHALQYVRPTETDDEEHVAFYSATHRIDAPVRILLAVATFGEKDGQPFVHCHALWTDDEGKVKGGHLHNDCVRVCEDTPVTAWGLGNAAMSVEFDAETNFSLFRPRAVQERLPPPHNASRCVVAKIRPNEDLLTSIEHACERYGIRRARIAGSVGSVVGATFSDGRRVSDIATEILVISGRVEPDAEGPCAQLRIALIDPRGDVHFGELARGENAVLICFELVLVEV